MRIAVENLELIHGKGFTRFDEQLTREIHLSIPRPTGTHAIGIVLISSNDMCRRCGSNNVGSE